MTRWLFRSLTGEQVVAEGFLNWDASDGVAYVSPTHEVFEKVRLVMPLTALDYILQLEDEEDERDEED